MLLNRICAACALAVLALCGNQNYAARFRQHGLPDLLKASAAKFQSDAFALAIAEIAKVGVQPP